MRKSKNLHAKRRKIDPELAKKMINRGKIIAGFISFMEGMTGKSIHVLIEESKDENGTPQIEGIITDKPPES